MHYNFNYLPLGHQLHRHDVYSFICILRGPLGGKSFTNSGYRLWFGNLRVGWSNALFCKPGE